MTDQTKDNSEDKVSAWASKPFRVEGRFDLALDEAGMSYFSSLVTPRDYTWKEFLAAFEQECADAWKQEVRSIASVTLPEGVFPGLTGMTNPVTREIVPVERLKPFRRRAPQPLFWPIP